MAEIQFGVWNIEWMNSLFEGDPPQFKAGDTKVRGPRKNNTVDDRVKDVSGVINEMDLQVLVVVEGPNRAGDLQLYFDRFLLRIIIGIRSYLVKSYRVGSFWIARIAKTPESRSREEAISDGILLSFVLIKNPDFRRFSPFVILK